MILVAGATGNLGGMVTRRLLEAGHPVRALVREHSDYHGLEEAGAEIAFGDLRSPPALQKACAGMTKVLCTASASGRSDESIEEVDGRGVTNLIDAAEAAGVERFVYVSAYGFDVIDAPIATAKRKNEARLKDSAMDWTILKPTAFMEAWIGWVVGAQLGEGPRVAIVGDGTEPMGFVASTDVADLCVAALERDEAANREIPLIAEVATMGEVLEKVREVTGMDFEVEHLAAGEAPPGFPPIIASLWKELQKPSYAVTTDTIETYGLKPVTLEAFTRQAFGSGAAPGGH
ncbi:MAG TPA: SDR family oxidoreductase [Gemmatimonadota bacterium]|nr:SDR family oxidoreductase [Gemmatimonadota bacterium]